MNFTEPANQRNVGVGVSGMISSGPPVVDSVGNLLGLIVQQTAELRERTAIVARSIAGSVPESGDKTGRPTQDCLLGTLRLISDSLGQALNEIERAQRAL